MISLPLIKYVLTAAFRDKLVLSLFLLVLVGASLATFLGSSAVTESDQFTVVFASGGLRIAAILGLVMFIVFHMRRSFETKDVDYLLTRPISRISFLLSHAIAFSLLAIMFAVFVSAAVYFLGGATIESGFYIWSFSLMIEFMIMANAALFFAMVLPNAAASAMAVFALYLLSRLIGQLLGIVETGLDLPGFIYLSYLMQFISLVIPRLDLMAQTSWLIYGPSENIGYLFIALQGLVYSALLVTASLVDLVKRQF